MSYLNIIVLIVKNFKYIAEFAKIIDVAIQRGISEAELSKSLNKLNRGFEYAITKKETASRASDINDSFRM